MKALSDYDFQKGEILVMNKPREWTSFGVVKRARWLISRHLGIKRVKIGHAGTLDPLASGVLILCTGKKTKQIESFQVLQKEYIANIRFGATTPSYDLESEVDETFPTEHITIELLQETLKDFIGEQEQTPPIFSAKKIGGKPAYIAARKGKEVEMRKSVVTIYELEVIENNFPDIRLRVVCGKGTYIRSLAYDLGKALNSGAHLTGLLRTRIGEYNLDNSITIEDLGELFGMPAK